MASQQCNITFQQYLLPASVIGIGFVIIVFFIIACVKCICSRRRKWSQGSLSFYGVKWNRIEQLSTKTDTRPLAIINAISLLDHALKAKGYLGETMHNRFTSAQNMFVSNNQIWKVIRLRNRLAHDADLEQLDEKKTKEALTIIRQALFDLNVYM